MSASSAEYPMIIAQFRTAMVEAGLDPGDTPIVADGRFHRYRGSDDKRGRENCWYVLFGNDIPAGAFGSWRTGESHKWSALQPEELNDADRERTRERVEAAHRAREAEVKRLHAEAAAKAQRLWNRARPAYLDHPYLEAKQVQPHGARLLGKSLVVPLHDPDSGKLTNLQFIKLDGSKTFLTGGRVAGCYFMTGTPVEPPGKLAVCEGFATGCSVAETGILTVVAFNAGNLKPVSEEIRKKYPDATMIIAADNDAWTAGNPGVTKATEAARATSAVLAVPQFKDTSSKPTDFNDLKQLEGPDAVRQQIEAAAPPARAERGQPQGFRTVRQYLEEMKARRAKKSYWEGILRAGEISLLVGRAYAGKSTFACALTRALCRGLPLLGRACAKTKVGYMGLERNGVTVASLFEKWGLADEVQYLDEIPGMAGEQLARYLEAEILRLGLEVVFVDHLQNLVKVRDGNDYAPVEAALMPFNAVAKRTRCHLALLHHQGKRERSNREIDVMGSEAYRAAADAILELKKSDDRHYIRGAIRGEPDLARTLVSVNLEIGEVRDVEAGLAESEEAQIAIAAFLETQDEPKTAAVIRDAVQLKASVVSAALKVGAEDGKFVRTGEGKRNHPYLYQTLEFYSHHVQGKAGRESENGQESERTEGVNRFPDSREGNSSDDEGPIV